MQTALRTQTPGQRWRAFALLVVAYFITIGDFTIVNVALPTIGRKLRFPEPDLQWVVTAYGLAFVMRRYLVVANQTLQAAELRDELRERISAGPCSFFVTVPDTEAAEYDPVAADGVLPEPGMWWWATYYARPATDGEATAQARQRPSVMLDGLAALGGPVEGDLGSSDRWRRWRRQC